MDRLQSDLADQQSFLNPDNEVFLKDFLEKYLHLESVLEQEHHVSKETKNTTDKRWKPLAGKLASGVHGEIVQILDSLSDAVENRERKKGFLYQRGEDHTFELIGRFLEKYPQFSENLEVALPVRVLSMGETMDRIYLKIAEILDEYGISDIPQIYRSSRHDSKHQNIDEMELNMQFNEGDIQITSQYNKFVEVLLGIGIDLNHVNVSTELVKLDGSGAPYKIVHIAGRGVDYPLTVVISEDATFLYRGYVGFQELVHAKKGGVAFGIEPIRISHDKMYQGNISRIFRSLSEDQPGENIEDLSLLRYQAVLLAESRKLKNIDIEVGEDGAYFFGNVKHEAFWSKINSIHLKNFPSNAFNKKYAIGDRYGSMSTGADLRKLFSVLGLKTASDAQEKAKLVEIYKTRFPHWAQYVVQSLGDYITEKNGIWYFREDRRTAYRPHYQYRFPVYDGDFSRFVRGYNIGSVNSAGDYLISQYDVVILLDIFGQRVATNEEGKKRQWKETLLSSEELLGQMGVIQKDGIWYFPELDRKFPVDMFLRLIQQECNMFLLHSQWNQKYGIGDIWGEIHTREHVKELFRMLGLRVATEEEESEYIADFSKILKNITIGSGEERSYSQ